MLTVYIPFDFADGLGFNLRLAVWRLSNTELNRIVVDVREYGVALFFEDLLDVDWGVSEPAKVVSNQMKVVTSTTA